MGRAEDEQIVHTAIENYMRVFTASKQQAEHAHRIVSEGSTAEVAAIAEALHSDPENFRGALLSDLFNEPNLGIAASIATVYSKDILPGRSIHVRTQKLKSAYDQWVSADETVFPDLHKDLGERGVWMISNESQAVRDRAKRFVAMFCATDELRPRASFAVRDELALLMLDDSREDHYRIIEFLRHHKGGKLTSAQLNFFLEGGILSLSGGAL